MTLALCHVYVCRMSESQCIPSMRGLNKVQGRIQEFLMGGGGAGIIKLTIKNKKPGGGPPLNPGSATEVLYPLSQAVQVEFNKGKVPFRCANV